MAVFCLLIASLDYYHDLSDKSVKKEVNKAINELKSNDEVKEEKEALDVESEELKQLDKNSLVKKYLDEKEIKYKDLGCMEEESVHLIPLNLVAQIDIPRPERQIKNNRRNRKREHEIGRHNLCGEM